jgi:hypothetical protein
MRGIERGDTFKPTEVVHTCGRFAEQHKQVFEGCSRCPDNVHGVIKDYKNWLNIVFELSPYGLVTRSSKHALRIVTLIHMNPDKFKGDEPWREREWYKVRDGAL